MKGHEPNCILFRYIQQILDTQRHISAGSKGQSLDRSKFTRNRAKLTVESFSSI